MSAFVTQFLDKPKAWAAAWMLVAKPLDAAPVIADETRLGPLALLAAMPPEAFTFLSGVEHYDDHGNVQTMKVVGATWEWPMLYVVQFAKWVYMWPRDVRPVDSSFYNFEVRGLERCVGCTPNCVGPAEPQKGGACGRWVREGVPEEYFCTVMAKAVYQVERRRLLLQKQERETR